MKSKSSSRNQGGLSNCGHNATKSMLSSRSFHLATTGIARRCDLYAMFDGRDRTLGRTQRNTRR